MPPRAGRHFLQIPGPSNVPDRVLRAIDRPVIDHRGPEFAKLAGAILQGLKSVFKTMEPIVIYPLPAPVPGKLPSSTPFRPAIKC
jgi:alanine-glyoxylate transaminase / serine-glyoxylate transaminase / serine-pyruvate transaminase